jgi:hypothetical protein
MTEKVPKIDKIGVLGPSPQIPQIRGESPGLGRSKKHPFYRKYRFLDVFGDFGVFNEKWVLGGQILGVIFWGLGG